ncbi:MAG: hypothetical protein IKD77_05795 [Bacilli bacterium]|nr:hypothetical protein [Bacilli bacterium]
MLIVIMLILTMCGLTGCKNQKDRTDNQSKDAINQNYKDLEWKLDTPIYFSDWTHAVVNAVSGVKTPMSSNTCS